MSMHPLGFWPLNGNPLDVSGNGNPGAPNNGLDFSINRQRIATWVACVAPALAVEIALQPLPSVSAACRRG